MATTPSQSIALPKSFGTKTISIAIGIVAFFVIYLAFIAFFIWLLAYTFEYSLLLLGAGFHIITVLVFLGANGFLVMILIFLLKIFIPSGKKKHEEGAGFEIKPANEPELFKLIYEVADGVKTYRPRKVFLIPDVNASVFHEQSLFSLFFPSHQNLNIGLGLVNSLTVVELKAVLAHEFGHFSQNITRVSGFIYRINKLIVDLLYSDGGWENTVRNSANLHGIIALFAALALYTALGIRWVFQKIYELVNLPYMSLSRDLEFHADAVAVNLTGKEALANALRKIDFTSVAYNSTTEHLDDFFNKDKLSCTNIFKVHNSVTLNLAALNELGIENNMLVITPETMNKFQKSRVYYKDQWATHPTQAEREANIAKYGQSQPYELTSAWTLFSNPEAVQEKMTKNLYADILATNKDPEIKAADADELNKRIKEEQDSTRVNPAYNNFYYNRVVSFDIEAAINEYNATEAEKLKFEEVYAAEHRIKIERLQQNTADKEVLEAIKAKNIKTSFFEFDGKRYKRKEAENLINTLNKEIEEQGKWLDETDKKALWFNLYKIEKRGETAKQEYITLFKKYMAAASCTSMFSGFGSFLHQQIVNFSAIVQDEDDLKPYLADLRSKEKLFKAELLKAEAQILASIFDDEKLKKEFINYVEDKNKFYLNLFSIKNHEVDNFFSFLAASQKNISNYYTKSLRQLTDLQLQ